MPNQHSTLTALFSDIASAIRAKGGTSASIAADAFPTAISNLPSGGGGDSAVDSILDRTVKSYSNSTCSLISRFAFAYCWSLSSVNFAEVSLIASNAFQYCSSLYNVSFPKCKAIYSQAFYQAAYTNTTGSSIIYSFPLCSSIGPSAFAYCRSLYSVYFPKCTTVGSSAFGYCSVLSVVSVGETATARVTISGYAFRNCTKLLSLYLMGPYVASLVANTAFTSTPISTYTNSTGGVYGKIYVPASLYSSYTTSTNWVNFSARMVSV